MVDQVDRAQELEQIQRDEALWRFRNRTAPPPAAPKIHPSPDHPTEKTEP